MEAVRPRRPRRIRDKDGSLGGGPNSYVLIHDGVNDSIAVDAEACEIKPTWNAAVCKGDVGRLNVGGAGGGGRGGAGAGGAGARPGGRGAASWRTWRSLGAAAGPGALAPAAAGPGGPVLVLAQRRSWRTWWSRRSVAVAAPAQPPVVLSRNGKEYTVTAAPTYEPVPRSRWPPKGRPCPSP